MHRERQATQADAQQNLGVLLARTYTRPRHGTDAFDPFEGSEVQRMLDGSGDGTH